jgi:DNA-binding transcriptional ArsR family regulator
MLNTIITSKTRIKLLLKFFLNPKTSSYLRQLAKEFGESTNSIRVELNKLTKAKILTKEVKGRNKIYRANTTHTLFEDIRNIVLKSTGIDKVISNIVQKLGNLQIAFVRGDYALGVDNGLIDLVVVGSGINMKELERVRLKTEELIQRKISILVLTNDEYSRLKKTLEEKPLLILFENK